MAPPTESEKALGEDPPLEVFYACRGCGRDQTDAWRDITPKPKMKPLTPETAARKFDELNPVIGSPGHANEDIDEIGQSDQLAKDPETIREACMRLGVGATIKNNGADV